MNQRVLIAEDDHYYRKFLLDVIEKENYEIVTAFDGNAALRHIEEDQFGLIILDFHLPGKDGYAILSHIRDKNIESSVIVLTADDSIETERIIRSFGPAYLFIKPFELSALRKVIYRVLEKPLTRSVTK